MNLRRPAPSPFGYEHCPNILDDHDGSFVYNMSPFSSYSPLDFLGGSMTSLSRFGPPESFRSSENILDDFK
ncbi:hypothetical protein SAY87_002895 [Trapa incisa]|uniref:Uncharacterized protein n=1 Tax=Trapa incisa TaxID=236973 RepID=A0AAN7KI67_9MYRT|nr:hypothetical protein SAY87_002895 [Trapa incisa]